MRIALSILIGIHGFIHLFGFLKAYGISEFNAISQHISKNLGILWLVAFLLFAVTLTLFLTGYRNWWIIGILAVILSQFLILNFWSDTKFGTILNLAILISIFIAFSTWSFRKKVSNELNQLYSDSQNSETIIVTEQMIPRSPEIVRKWLLNSGIVGKEIIQNVSLEQEIQMLLKPEQKDWTKAKAKQYFTVEPPGFNWSVDLNMKPGLRVVGRDKYKDGKGEMIIKLLSVIPLANAKNSKKVDEATLQRYLAEIVWFPSAALSPYIAWEAVNEHSAKGIMKFKGIIGWGEFHFKEDGDFEKFVAMRYKHSSDTEPTQWTVTATKTEKRNGIKIPVESKVEWKLDSGNWTWLKLKISDIKYNLENFTYVWK